MNYFEIEHIVVNDNESVEICPVTTLPILVPNITVIPKAASKS